MLNSNDMEKKYLIISLAVNIILVLVIGYFLFDLGILQAEKQLTEIKSQVSAIQNQVNLNKKNIQDIIDFINSQVQINQQQIKK